MDNSLQEMQNLVEKYVTGLMTEEEALEFEVFILAKPDWQSKIDLARQRFEQIQQEEWTHELEQTLAQQTHKPTSSFSWRFSFMPSAVAFGLGALMVVMLQPVPIEQALGKAHRVNLAQTRSAGQNAVTKMTVSIDSEVDALVFNLPVAGNIRLSYSVGITFNGKQTIRKGYVPNDYGDLTFSLAREFNHGELITLHITAEAGSDVVREYQLLIKEK